jgi:hypothetical protein
VIEALAPDRSDKSFDIGVLPRRARQCQDFLNADGMHMIERIIAIAEEIARQLVPRKGVSKLLNGPRGRRMLRDRDMHHAPAIMGKEYQDKQQPARRGRHDEEVSRNQLLGMVGQERSPGLRGEWSAANHVFGDGSLERR